jgi:hypothetical protein
MEVQMLRYAVASAKFNARRSALWLEDRLGQNFEIKAMAIATALALLTLFFWSASAELLHYAATAEDQTAGLIALVAALACGSVALTLVVIVVWHKLDTMLRRWHGIK